MAEQSQTQQAKIHIKETHVDPTYGRIFEGWMSGDALNVFGDLAHTHCAMTSSQAIAYCCEVEKVAHGVSVISREIGDNRTLEVERVYDFLNASED
jgi:hypothetical protein